MKSHKRAAQLLEEGFRFGIRISSMVTSWGGGLINLPSAREHPEVVAEKLAKEVQLGRISEPFPRPPLVNLFVSPLGVVPEKRGK